MQAKFTFRLSALTLGVVGALAAGQAMASYSDEAGYAYSGGNNGNFYITGNQDNINSGEGVFIRSNGTVTAASYGYFQSNGNATINGSANLYLNSPLTSISADTTVGGTLGVTGATTLSGATTINNTLAVNGATTIVGVTTINANAASATNINAGTSSAAVTVGNANNTTNLNSATNNIGVNSFATTNNIGTGSVASQNNIGNSSTGTTAITTAGNSVVTTKNNAASTIVTGSAGTSSLDGGTTTSGGSAVLLKGGSGTQTVVDANGKLTNVTGTATQSTASLTLTNGVGNVHGLVVTETQATLSGGTNSSSLTMADNGATFSDTRNGKPVQVHGVDDGTAEFDAVNVRQFAGAIASVTAMANIPQVDQDKTFAMGMGVGGFMGRSALAAGVTYRFAPNAVFKGSVSSAMTTSNSTTVGFGAAWSY